MLKRQKGEERLKNKDNITGEQLAAVLREQTEWERRIKPIEKKIDKLEETLGKLAEYDKEIAGLRRDVNYLKKTVDGMVESVVKPQVEINRGVLELFRITWERIERTSVEIDRGVEEMEKAKRMINEISKKMEVGEKVIEGFEAREQE